MLPFLGKWQLLARRDTPFGPSTWVGLGFALWFGICVGWMTYQAPDWMLMYTIPASDLPLIPLHILFIVFLVINVLAGHTLNAVLIQRGHTRPAIAVMLGAMAVWLSTHVFTVERYLAVGTFDDFYAGNTQLLPQSDLAMHTNGVALLLFVWLIPAVNLVRHGRRLRPT